MLAAWNAFAVALVLITVWRGSVRWLHPRLSVAIREQLETQWCDVTVFVILMGLALVVVPPLPTALDFGFALGGVIALLQR